jgi:trk/ktr system potassium uptake protein
MKVIVVGQGSVGFNVAETLVKEGCDVSVIEQDELLFKNVTNKLDVLAIFGSGTSPDNLVSAGIEKADTVIAATAKDEVNILVCALGKQFGVETRIARLYSDEYTKKDTKVDIKKLGVTHYVLPELLTVANIKQYIETPGSTEVANFGDQKIILRGSKLPQNSKLISTKINENKLLMDDTEPLLIAGIEKENEFIIPAGDYSFEENDNVLALLLATSYQKFYKLFGLSEKKVEKVILSGASLLGIKTAQMLEKMVSQVILIEPEPEMAEKAAALLNKTEVIQSNYDEEGLLASLNIQKTDFFIAVHKRTRDNMMAAMLASESGAKEILVITTDSRHQRLFNSVGIDYVINPYLITSSSILDIVRGDLINNITDLSNGLVEALELIVEKKSKIDGKDLKSIWKKIHGKALVGAVVRNNNISISKGNTVMHAGDRVIVICKKDYLPKLKKIFIRNPSK